jgi:hypothetical protein
MFDSERDCSTLFVPPHSLGDSGCPCNAFLTGITYPAGIGSFPKYSSHHCRDCASGFMKNGDVGAGASAKALPTSYPLQMYK